jgi:hypothetical protein
LAWSRLSAVTGAAPDLQLTDEEIGALEEHYMPRLPTYFN